MIAPLQSLREWWSTIVASLGRWFRPPRHVLTLSLGVTGALSLTIGWLVWLLIALMINAATFPRFDFSPDGKAIFYATPSLSDRNPGSVAVRDLQSGRDTTLLQGKGLSFVSVSPDGQRLAVVGSDKGTQILSVMPAAGGGAREIARIDGDEANWRVAPVWTPDGRHVVFVKGLKGRPTRNVQLWRVSAEGGEPEQLGLTVDELWWLRLHPDGRRVALGTSQSKFEVWAMENFLPELKAPVRD